MQRQTTCEIKTGNKGKTKETKKTNRGNVGEQWTNKKRELGEQQWEMGEQQWEMGEQQWELGEQGSGFGFVTFLQGFRTSFVLFISAPL